METDSKSNHDIDEDFTSVDYFAIKCAECGSEREIQFPWTDSKKRFWLEQTCPICFEKSRFVLVHIEEDIRLDSEGKLTRAIFLRGGGIAWI